MTTQLPAPPLPPTVDLRDFPGMMLEVARLRDSAIVSKTKPEEFRSAVLLWCAAWHQLPAASLPDDEGELAKFAGYGLAVKSWEKVRAGALRGFVKCSDGRLYHLVVAEKAIVAFQSKLQQRYDSECGRLKKEAQRKKVEWHKPEFALWITKECPEFVPYLSRRQRANVPEEDGSMSPGHPPTGPRDVPRETVSKRSEGKGSKDLNHRFPGVVSTPAPVDRTAVVEETPPRHPPAEVLNRIMDELRRGNVTVEAGEDSPIVERWIREGATGAQVAIAVMEARAPGSKPYPELLRIGYVDAVLKRILKLERDVRSKADARVEATLEDNAEQRGHAMTALPPDQPIPEAAAKFVKHRPLER